MSKGRHRQPGRHRAARERRSHAPWLAAGAVLLVAAAAVWTAGHRSQTRFVPATESGIGESTRSATPAAPASTAPGPDQAARAALAASARAEIEKIADDLPDGSVSVAVADLAGGPTFAAGETKGMHTASVYKLLVLETLLRQGDGPLTGSQNTLAKQMIEYSANKPGYSLYESAGGCPALRKTVKILEMRHTEVYCDDPTFTRTGAADLLAALRTLTSPGMLTSSERKYARRLLYDVTPGQRWGVGAVAATKGDFYNKNGWLSVDDDNSGFSDDGRWIASSVGVVRVHGHTLLMSVFTQHQPSYDKGVKLVEKLARIAASAVPTS